jgi:hypothetical protein
VSSRIICTSNDLTVLAQRAYSKAGNPLEETSVAVYPTIGSWIARLCVPTEFNPAF